MLLKHFFFFPICQEGENAPDWSGGREGEGGGRRRRRHKVLDPRFSDSAKFGNYLEGRKEGRRLTQVGNLISLLPGPAGKRLPAHFEADNLIIFFHL